MGLLERVIQEEKKQTSAGLLKKAGLIRGLSDQEENTEFSSDTVDEFGEKKKPTPPNLYPKKSPTRKKD
jgi:hypothetical protein